MIWNMDKSQLIEYVTGYGLAFVLGILGTWILCSFLDRSDATMDRRKGTYRG